MFRFKGKSFLLFLIFLIWKATVGLEMRKPTLGHKIKSEFRKWKSPNLDYYYGSDWYKVTK